MPTSKSASETSSDPDVCGGTPFVVFNFLGDGDAAVNAVDETSFSRLLLRADFPRFPMVRCLGWEGWARGRGSRHISLAKLRKLTTHVDPCLSIWLAEKGRKGVFSSLAFGPMF